MRKIEKEMLGAIHLRQTRWTKDNTEVLYMIAGYPSGPRSEIYLHGFHIATYWHKVAGLPYDRNNLEVNIATLRQWPTMTTRRRLRALGANLVSKKGKLYLENEAIQ